MSRVSAVTVKSPDALAERSSSNIMLRTNLKGISD